MDGSDDVRVALEGEGEVEVEDIFDEPLTVFVTVVVVVLTFIRL